MLLASLATGLLVGAHAARAQGSHPIRIAAGPLESALMSLASQTHEQLLYPPELVAGRRAPALEGDYTAEAALARLLAGDEITVTRAGPDVLVLKARIDPGPKRASRPDPTRADQTDPPHPFGGEAEASAATAPAATAPPPATVSEVEVTGTHIHGAQTASPLMVVTRQDLERTGEPTLVGALRKLPQFFGGGDAEGTEVTGGNLQGGNRVFATGLNLHGLGDNATLVLVNGRRMAGTGGFGDFVDVSSIPAAAVDHVEILLDGASALYGSDAVGGVVNIILRRNYQGAEVRLDGGVATQGGAKEGQVSATLGRRWTGGGLVASYEARRRDGLAASKRPFTATGDLRPFGGTDHRVAMSFPGNIETLTAAGFVPVYAIPAGQNGVGLTPAELQAGAVNLSNLRGGQDLLPRQRQQSAYLSVDQEIGDRFQLSADALFNRRDYTIHNAWPVSTFTVTRANPFYVSPTGAPSEWIGYSFSGDLPPPAERGSSETLATTVGGNLRLAGDWRAEAYAAFAQETDRVHDTGLLNTGFLAEALGSVPDNPTTGYSAARDGFFNPFSGIPGSNSAAVTRFIGSGETSDRMRDQVVSADLKADGTLFQLPGGALKGALGIQGRRESYVSGHVSLTSGPTPVPGIAADYSSRVGAAYAEVDVPLFGPSNARPGFRRLEVSVAGRVERYQRIGSTTNPKVGVLWQPSEDLQVRGTYGTSFRAPELHELFQPQIYSPSTSRDGANRVVVLFLSGGNAALRPETATSWTAGLDYRPARWPGLQLQGAWFDTQFHNRIGRPVLANLGGVLNDPTLAGFVQRVSPMSNPADLALINGYLNSPRFNSAGTSLPAASYAAVVDIRYVNTSALHVEGIDFGGSYRFDAGSDRVVVALNGEYLLRYDEQLTPTAPTLDHLNLPNFPLRFRSRATADWTHGPVTAGVALNYANAYRDVSGARIADQATVDLQLRLDPRAHGPMKGVAVLLNVRNLFDKAPPFYDNPFGLGYDPSNGDPIGRFVSLQLIRSW